MMSWLTAIPGAFKLVPRWLWEALGVALLFAAAVHWYHGQIAAAEKRGGDAAYADIKKQADALEQKTNALAAKIRSHNDEEARHIAAGADNLRLRGPGKAACSGPAAAAAGGHVAASGAVVPGLPDLPGEQWQPLVGVPYPSAVDFAEVCDLNRNEVLSWRDWYARVQSEYAKAAHVGKMASAK